jgi:ankyrin repeat protein
MPSIKMTFCTAALWSTWLLCLLGCSRNVSTDLDNNIQSHTLPPDRPREPAATVAQAVREQNMERLRQLQTPQNLNELVDGETPLHLALRLHAYEIATSLSAEPYLDPTLVNGDGLSYLFLAARSGDQNVIRNLIAQFKKTRHFYTLRFIDPVTPDGQIALHQAADGAIAELLYEAQVAWYDDDMNMHDNRGQTPAHAAARDGRDSVLRWVNQAYCSGKGIPWWQAQIQPLASKVYSAGKIHPFDAKDMTGRTPLMLAAQFRSESTLLAILDGCGQAVTAELTDIFGNTALHYAAFNPDLRVFETLASHMPALRLVENKARLTPSDVQGCVIRSREGFVDEGAQRAKCLRVAGALPL